MPTYTEALPPTLSSRHGGIKWTPAAEPQASTAGLLVIADEHQAAAYQLTEFRCDFRGRAFRLAKVAGGTDAEAAGYDVYLADDGRSHSCECRGWLRWRRDCKHVAACLALAANGWLAGQTPIGTAYGCRAVEPAPQPAAAPVAKCAADLDYF